MGPTYIYVGYHIYIYIYYHIIYTLTIYKLAHIYTQMALIYIYIHTHIIIYTYIYDVCPEKVQPLLM